MSQLSIQFMVRPNLSPFLMRFFQVLVVCSLLPIPPRSHSHSRSFFRALPSSSAASRRSNTRSVYFHSMFIKRNDYFGSVKIINYNLNACKQCTISYYILFATILLHCCISKFSLRSLLLLLLLLLFFFLLLATLEYLVSSKSY